MNSYCWCFNESEKKPGTYKVQGSWQGAKCYYTNTNHKIFCAASIYITLWKYLFWPYWLTFKSLWSTWSLILRLVHDIWGFSSTSFKCNETPNWVEEKSIRQPVSGLHAKRDLKTMTHPFLRSSSKPSPQLIFRFVVLY